MKKFSLRASLIVMFLSALCLHLAFNAGLEYRELRRATIVAGQREAAAILENLARNAPRYSQAELESEIAFIAKPNEILALALVDAAGRVRASNRRDWRGRDAASAIPEFLAAEFAAVQQTPLARQRAETTGARAIAWHPYIKSSSNEPPGAFFLLLDLKPRQTALLQDLLRTQAFNWVGALILLTVLYLWLSYYVVRPLETLRRELQSLDPAGNRPIAQVGPREITALIHAFNEMSSELAVTWRAIPDLLFEVDPQGRCIRLTTGRPELLTRPVESFVGQRVDEIMPPASAAVVMAALKDAERDGGVWGRQIGLEGPGEHRWYEFSVARKDRGAGLAPHFIVFSHNITGRKHAEERQRLAARIFDASREGIVLTDAEGVIQMVNPAFVAITGYSADEAIGQSAQLLDPHRHGDAFYAEMWRMLSSEGYWAGEIWSRRKDGQPLPEWLSMSAIRNEAGAVSHYVGVFTDLRELKASQARIHDLAWHHPLTSLPNRAFLLTRMEEAVGVETKTGKRGFALMLINLRGFQRVNASYGIEAGDAVLREAGRRAVNAAAGRLVCHLDGDEFGVFISSGVSQKRATRLAEALLGELTQPYTLVGAPQERQDVHLGAAVGIALYPLHSTTVAGMIQQADAALKVARGEDDSSYHFASAELTEATRRRVNLETRLRSAIAERQLLVYYQPQIDIRHGNLIGAEALVRWRDPIVGLVAPVHFIPIAEESGLIVDIGRWVLEETCRQGAAWRAAGLPPLVLAVNVAARQLYSGDLVKDVQEILARTGFSETQLELELTESTLMDDSGELMHRLERLRACGVELAIDDFGTGYSSLSYLQRFPATKLKIDKCFIDDLAHQAASRQIVAAIVALGHAMKLDVLAEGVESAEQLEWLERLGVDSWQGYLCSKPLPAAEFEELLKSRR